MAQYDCTTDAGLRAGLADTNVPMIGRRFGSLQAAIEKLLRDDDAAPVAPAAAPSAADREAERAARLRFFEPRASAAAPAPAPAAAPTPAPPAAPTAPTEPPSIKEMKETIRKAGLATADLLERPHVEERYKKALARLAKVVDLTCDE